MQLHREVANHQHDVSDERSVAKIKKAYAAFVAERAASKKAKADGTTEDEPKAS